MLHHSDCPHFSIILLYFFKTKYLEPEATCVEGPQFLSLDEQAGRRLTLLTLPDAPDSPPAREALQRRNLGLKPRWNRLSFVGAPEF